MKMQRTQCTKHTNNSTATATAKITTTSASRRRTYTVRIGFINNLLRTSMLIAFGLANLNNGLRAYETTATDSNSNSSSSSHFSDSHASSSNSVSDYNNNNAVADNSKNAEYTYSQRTQQHQQQQQINQNLIMSTTSALNLGNSMPRTAALTADAAAAAPQHAASPYTGYTAQTGMGAFNMPMPYPSSSITATSTMEHQQHQQHQQQHQSSGSSSSIITSFDSTNVIDDRLLQQQQQHQSSNAKHQQQQHFPNTLARPLHKVIGLNHPNAGIENQLDEHANGIDGDDVYSTPMYFGTENSTIVSTQIGASAHIPCTVHHIGDGVVSWIRRKDYHLLTVGLTTYSSDERFSATHLKGSEDWTLQIKFVQLRDAGVYECQVSTHPPTSIFLHLNVVEARAEISGPPIRYLTPGSTLRLQCRVVQNTEASEFIFWYHDNRMINYDIDRGINVSTEPDFQSSELTIMRTRREHSGNFTCVASNTQPASVLVHIFKGDNPAAMYHGHVGSSTKTYQTHMHHYMALIAIGYRILHINLHIKIV